MKRILIVTDVWDNVNGVVTSLRLLKKTLEHRGNEVIVIHPADFPTIPLITYPEIRLAISTRAKVLRMIESYQPDYIHIATEGSLGFIARLACTHKKIPFTTSYYTDFPEYIEMRFKGFREPTFKYLKWFHSKSKAVMVSTESMLQSLQKKGFNNLVLVYLGIDINRFVRNNDAQLPTNLTKPVFISLGRLAPEKNVEAFLDCNLPGSKLVVGDGPSRAELEEKYPNAVFVGYKSGQELVDLLSVSDVFVFPSMTDTFGLVILEAMACGLPVAAYDAVGSRDLISNGSDGYFGPDLVQNAIDCLDLDSTDCRKKAEQYSVERWVNNFVKHLVPIK